MAIRGVGAMLVLVLGSMGWGCRAHPASLGLMLVGDVVADADLGSREAELMGKPPSAADEAFGERTDTFTYLSDERRQVLWYAVDPDFLSVDRYLVEVSSEEIVALTRTKENIDGAEDVIRSLDLQARLIGKTQAECEQEGRLGQPVESFRCEKSSDRVLVYDVRNFTNLRGARYGLLRFDGSGKCSDIKLVGVSASTKKEPLSGRTEPSGVRQAG